MAFASSTVACWTSVSDATCMSFEAFVLAMRMAASTAACFANTWITARMGTTSFWGDFVGLGGTTKARVGGPVNYFVWLIGSIVHLA